MSSRSRSKSASRSRKASRAASRQCRDPDGQFTPCAPSRRRSKSRGKSRRRSASRPATTLASAQRRVEKDFRLQVAEAQELTAANALRPVLLEQEATIFERQARLLREQAVQVAAYQTAQRAQLEEARARAQQAQAAAAAAIAAAQPVPVVAAAAAAAPGAGDVVYVRTAYGPVQATVLGPAPQAGTFRVRGPVGAANAAEVVVRGDDIIVPPIAGPLAGAFGLGAGLGLPLAGAGILNPLNAGLLGGNPLAAAALANPGLATRSRSRRSLSAAEAENLARAQLYSNPYLQASVMAEPCWTDKYDDCPELYDAAAAYSGPYF